jgi:hypothetical protein
LLQHPHLFGDNSVFAARLLVSIVGDENLQGRISLCMGEVESCN